MKRHGKWLLETECEEQPDYNFYTVSFYKKPDGDPVARVWARVYMNFGENAKEVRVDRLNPDELKSVDDSELVQIAEIEVNSMPGFQEYVVFPGAVPNPVHQKHA